MAEQLLHFGSLTARIQGTGNAFFTLFNLDRTKSFSCTALTMSASPGREPTKLCNFIQQRALYRLQTFAIDDYMKVNRIVMFVKPYGTMYPQ